METRSQSEPPKELESLRELLTNLVDAVRYVQHADETEAKKREIEANVARQLQKIDEFVANLSGELDGLVGELETDSVKTAGPKISGFVQMAMEQAKEAISREGSRSVDELSSTVSLEKTKAMKSLEAFLASTPIPVIESVLSVRLVDSVYVAKCRYRCEGEIDYDFSLGTQNSKVFRQEFRLSRAEGPIKVPVRLGRTWSKKEPVPHFERLDRYFLTAAELTDGNLSIDLMSRDLGSRFRIVHSKGRNQDFSSIEFFDERGTVNVLKDPGLNTHLDFELIRSAIDNIKSELASLEKNKITVARLSAAGHDILENLSIFEFLKDVLKTMEPAYRGIIARISGGEALGAPGALVDLRMLKQRVKLLGPNGKAVSDLLGLPGSS
jgi:hypothetical protein